ncbi:MAG: hypothetical protein ABH859_05045 [Pseudomonadota bacterium]
MFKLIKWILILIILAIIVAAVTGYKIKGKTVTDHFRQIVGAQTFDEGLKDIRSLAGEAIKAAGDAISPNANEATEDEKKQLENIIKGELKQEAPTHKQLPDQTQ